LSRPPTYGNLQNCGDLLASLGGAAQGPVGLVARQGETPRQHLPVADGPRDGEGGS